MDKEQILEIISHQVEKLKTDYSVKQIGLFGSTVRDEQTSNSDIDILVDFVEPTFDHYMDLKFYLERLFQTRVDLVMKDTIKRRLKPIIEGEVIYAKRL